MMSQRTVPWGRKGGQALSCRALSSTGLGAGLCLRLRPVSAPTFMGRPRNLYQASLCRWEAAEEAVSAP